MNQEAWANAPKMFLQDTNVAFMGSSTGDMALIAMITGGNAVQVFAATPGHAKRFAQMVAWHVEQYEKVNGNIDVPDWTSDIVSPVQFNQDQQGKEKK